jgi:hypothetical protein
VFHIRNKYGRNGSKIPAEGGARRAGCRRSRRDGPAQLDPPGIVLRDLFA